MLNAASATRNIIPVTTLRFRFIPSSSTRARHSLVQRSGRAHTPVNPFLHAFAFASFTRIHVSARIDGHAPDSIKQTGVAPTIAEPRNRCQRVTLQDPDRLV